MSADSPIDKPVPSSRLQSIDALRGFDMFWIIGGGDLASELAALFGLHKIVRQFQHADWHGFRFFDLIFPLFLFVVGVVLPFSLSKFTDQAAGKQDRRAAHWRVFRRALVLFFLGLVYSGFLQLNLADFRWLGVLQRIAICYFFAALAELHLSVMGKSLLLVTLLLGYWCVLLYVPAPGFMPYDLTVQGSLAGYLDRLLIPGKLYYGLGDNEGFLSTFPSIATTLIGVLAGHWLRSNNQPGIKVQGLFLAAAVCLVGGYTWRLWFPLNKFLWTSSFVLVTSGYSLALLGTFYGLIDVLGWKRWSFFFTVIGTNAITIYLMDQFVDFRKMSEFFLGGINRYFGQLCVLIGTAEQVQHAQNALLLAGIITIEWLILWYLYRNKTFLRV